jgi:hypothetical protein
VSTHLRVFRGQCSVGRYYPGWRALARSFRDAQFAFETERALYGLGRVFFVEDLGLAGCR